MNAWVPPQATETQREREKHSQTGGETYGPKTRETDKDSGR
ncbi:hypothetical protein CCHR01_05270 [Colletotrichum chrysophilum]|uniref:Uncharacterized protein n=1 Tax=Colletotrichum chrysophilum TaxID=1836956 RepID=A0AAD9AQF0_9PEZI|nr:hypothetical protein CCHR01_05270 [Colletotrichum chrysophilum]